MNCCMFPRASVKWPTGMADLSSCSRHFVELGVKYCTGMLCASTIQKQKRKTAGPGLYIPHHVQVSAVSPRNLMELSFLVVCHIMEVRRRCW